MHYLYLVAVKKEEDTEQKELAQEMSQELSDNGFCGDGGYWNNCKSDWFVIGGRWSGYLQEIQLDNWSKKAKELVNAKNSFISTKDIEDNKEKLQELWISLGGKGQNVWDRDTYKNEGYDDDCMLLDDNLFKALEKGIFEETEVAIYEDGYIQNEMYVKDWLKEKDIVNNYYLVVVDCHN